MKFRLTYEGRLESSGNTGKLRNVWEIRKALHPQLKRLWEVEPNLKNWKYFPTGNAAFRTVAPGSDVFRAWEQLANANQRNGYRFVPIVTEQFSLLAGLEILFLRTGNPGAVLSQGDIDGRLKTLFDGLKMPKNTQEHAGFENPGPDEDPFFVLLEDDSLINRVAVETDVLLEPTPSANGQFLKNDARVIITVHIKQHDVNMDNLHFV